MPLVNVWLAWEGWPVARQAPQGVTRWGDYVFAVNEIADECDAWVVVEGLRLPLKCRCPADRTFFIGLEPPIHETYHEGFLSQFARVVTCGGHASGHPRHSYSFPPQPWFFGMDEGPKSCTLPRQLRYWGFEEIAALEPKKTRLLSIVCSDKTHTAGHRKRYEFARALKAHFGDALDWFGNGINPVVDKAQALLDYKYHIALENSAFPHYWTEKLADAYLGWTLPIYFGCPNVSDYFPPQSLVRIDPDDFAGTIATIEKVVNASAWETSFAAIREARRRVLEEYNFFPAIIRILEQAPPGRTKTTIRLQPPAYFVGRARTFLRRARARLQFGWGVTRVLPFLKKI